MDPLLSRFCFFRESALTFGESASFARREIVDPLLSRSCLVANPLLSRYEKSWIRFFPDFVFFANLL